MGLFSSLFNFCGNSNEKLLNKCKNELFVNLKTYSKQEIEVFENKIQNVRNT